MKNFYTRDWREGGKKFTNWIYNNETDDEPHRQFQSPMRATEAGGVGYFTEFLTIGATIEGIYEAYPAKRDKSKNDLVIRVPD